MNKKYRLKDIAHINGIYKSNDSNLFIIVVDKKALWISFNDLKNIKSLLNRVLKNGWNANKESQLVTKTILYRKYFSKLGRLLYNLDNN